MTTDGASWEPKETGRGPCAMLREFGSCGGLALVAGRLPAPRTVPTRQRAPPPPQHDLEWVKLDDAYEVFYIFYSIILLQHNTHLIMKHFFK